MRSETEGDGVREGREGKERRKGSKEGRERKKGDFRGDLLHHSWGYRCPCDHLVIALCIPSSQCIYHHNCEFVTHCVKCHCSVLTQRRYILLILIKLVIIDVSAVKRNFRRSLPNGWSNVTSRFAVHAIRIIATLTIENWRTRQ